MTIETTTRLGDFDSFKNEFEAGMERLLFGDRSLVLLAAGNSSAIDRFQIMDFLLDHDCRVDGQGAEGVGIFHILFGATTRDTLPETERVVGRLLTAGADPNHLDKRGRDALFELMIVGASDEALTPLYDLWLAQDLQNINTPAGDGYTPLEAARLLPYRSDLVQRMERLNG